MRLVSRDAVLREKRFPFFLGRDRLQRWQRDVSEKPLLKHSQPQGTSRAATWMRLVSRDSVSREKRLSRRPLGWESKKDMGRRRMRCSRWLCSFLELPRLPCSILRPTRLVGILLTKASSKHATHALPLINTPCTLQCRPLLQA